VTLKIAESLRFFYLSVSLSIGSKCQRSLAALVIGGVLPSMLLKLIFFTSLLLYD